MLQACLKMWSLLTPKERFRFYVIGAMMAVCAFLDLLGLGLVMPVVAILANPALLDQNKYLNAIHDFVNPSSNASFLLILCGAVAALYVGKNAFLALTTWLQLKFVYAMTRRLAAKLFEKYLEAPYAFHLAKGSPELLNNISMAGYVAGGFFTPATLFATESLVVVAILGTLLFFTPLATLGLALISAGLLTALYIPFRKMNSELGERINLYGGEVFRDIMQSFEGVKECKVRNCEAFLSERHAKHQSLLRESECERSFLGQLPRFAIEAFVIAAGMGMLAAFVISGMAAGSIVLKLSLVAAAMIRLMPSFSRMQYQLSSMRQATPAFNVVFEGLAQSFQRQPSEAKNKDAKPIEFKKSISVEKVSFSYEGSGKPVLSDFSIEIPKNASVAFVGTTGCGKTTLMDVMLGLLKPSSGRVLVDGRDIEENLYSWHEKIGYVPQTIFLMDASIRENVAFGERPENIDEAQIRKCLETAQLLDFIDSLPKGLDTMAGERGVRLSGGQRQRIGIARALYRNPEVLMLDEATSALDNDTEKAFVDALKTLRGKLTIIMIAHRLTTVENCDAIARLDRSQGDACEREAKR